MATASNNQANKPNITNGSHSEAITAIKDASNTNSKGSATSPPISNADRKDDDVDPLQTLDFTLSPEVEAKLREVIPSDDPLDCADFDVISHVNSLFPSEESLGDVHDGPLAFRISHIRRQVNQIDGQLSKAVQTAAINRRKTQAAISETQSSIQDLFKKVQSIKEKAVESEVMVEEICSDIRKLDNAKKNLSESITTLQKLHMLVSGVEQLQKDAATKSYDRASNMVQALDDLFLHFKDHLSLTQLKSLKLDMEKTREELKKNIYRDFRRYTPEQAIDDMGDTLRNACEVIDVMGDVERTEFIDWTSSTQLQAYGAIFSPGGQKSGIEYIERRFEWLKNQLLKYNKNYARILPRYWNVPGHICKEFCDITREHLSEILMQSAAMNSLDMNDLVKSLEQCVSFEKELQRLYSRPSFSDDLEKIRVSIKNLLGDYDEEDLYADPMTADKIRTRYRLEQLKKKLTECESQMERENAYKSTEQKEREKGEEIQFMGILSSAFNQYMHYYVELEKKSINDVLHDIATNEHWMVTLDHIPNEARYGGMDDLLGYIKGSIHRCSKIGTGDIFYKIYHEYRDGLVHYVDLLSKKVTAFNNEIMQKNKSGKTIDSELVSLSLIVNTLDYLNDTLEALEGKLKSSLAQTNQKLAKKVNLKDIQEEKSEDLASKTVKCIAQMVTQRIGIMLDKEVTQCRRWNDVDQSSERSAFLMALKSILNRDVAIIHEMLVLSHHNLFNSQMSQRLIPRYIGSIFRIKRISAEGALQLQLDTRGFEKTMLELPTIGMEDDGSTENEVTKEMNLRPNQGKQVRVSSAYRNITSKQVNRIQSLLKTIVVNYTSDTIGSIATFYRDVSHNGHHEDLMRICDMKGLQRKEKETVIQIYNRIVPKTKQAKPLIPNPKLNADNDRLFDVFRDGFTILRRDTAGR